MKVSEVKSVGPERNHNYIAKERSKRKKRMEKETDERYLRNTA